MFAISTSLQLGRRTVRATVCSKRANCNDRQQPRASRLARGSGQHDLMQFRTACASDSDQCSCLWCPVSARRSRRGMSYFDTTRGPHTNCCASLLLPSQLPLGLDSFCWNGRENSSQNLLWILVAFLHTIQNPIFTTE